MKCSTILSSEALPILAAPADPVKVTQPVGRDGFHALKKSGRNESCEVGVNGLVPRLHEEEGIVEKIDCATFSPLRKSLIVIELPQPASVPIRETLSDDPYLEHLGIEACGPITSFEEEVASQKAVTGGEPELSTYVANEESQDSEARTSPALIEISHVLHDSDGVEGKGKEEQGCKLGAVGIGFALITSCKGTGALKMNTIRVQSSRKRKRKIACVRKPAKTVKYPAEESGADPKLREKFMESEKAAAAFSLSIIAPPPSQSLEAYTIIDSSSSDGTPSKPNSPGRPRKEINHGNKTWCRPRKWLPHRIAISCGDTDMKRLYYDVIAQLGASIVLEVFDRGEPPTHFVMCDDGEITPALLLSKALGIPVLCTQWLIDAIPMGCFTDNLDGYFHPRYGMAACVGESTLSVPDEVTEDTREGILGNHSDGNSSLYFEENVGPYYKPLFVGLTILFLSESFSEHASMFKHIVRLLGGTATLSTSALNISVIVNLSYGATHRPNHTTDGGFNEKNTKEGSGVEARSTKGNKKNNKKQPPREVSDSVLNIATPVEHIPLSITYPGVSFCAQGGVMGIASCRNNEVTKFTCVQRVLKLRASSGLNTPPVVSVEWFVNCILQGRVVDTARYTIPTAAEECVVPVKRHVANPSTAYVGDNVNVPVESE